MNRFDYWVRQRALGQMVKRHIIELIKICKNIKIHDWRTESSLIFLKLGTLPV